MKLLSSLLFFFIGLLAVAQAQTISHNQLDSTSFGRIYPHALRGDMTAVFKMLEKTDNTSLTTKQLQKKRDYYERFLFRSESFDFNTEDPQIVDLYRRFQDYWRSVILENTPQQRADSLFRMETTYFLKKNYRPDLGIREIIGNNFKLFMDYFESKNLHGIAMGKTGHLYDLYLWKDQEEVEYKIDLPEGQSISVPVVFMRDFISNGWSHYTTFGHSFSGGWASPTKLYCVEESYGPKDEEEFLISYVSHEGQHFSDYKIYPELMQADLEYRAKLTELALAEETIYNIVNKFITNAKDNTDFAHGYANHMVIELLSDRLFNSDFESDLGKWKKVSQKKISRTALLLLKEHSAKLNELGSETIEAYITSL